MANIDITQLTGIGVQPYYAQEIDHGLRPNGLGYKIKYQYAIISDVSSEIVARFYVKRYFQDGTDDISYTFDSIANDTSFVDKFGDLVEENDPNKWGTEMEYFRVLLSYGINKDVLEGWQLKLFNRGTLDRPKNSVIN